MPVAEATNWNFLFPSPGFLFFFFVVLCWSSICMYFYIYGTFSIWN